MIIPWSLGLSLLRQGSSWLSWPHPPLSRRRWDRMRRWSSPMRGSLRYRGAYWVSVSHNRSPWMSIMADRTLFSWPWKNPSVSWVCLWSDLRSPSSPSDRYQSSLLSLVVKQSSFHKGILNRWNSALTILQAWMSEAQLTSPLGYRRCAL